MKKNRKIFIYKVLLIILVITACIIASIILNKQYQDRVYDKENKEIVELFHKQEESNHEERNNEKIQLKYKGYNVIGIIKIPSIDVEYPILSDTSMNAMNISIIKFSGGELNDFGNVALAGHNNYSGTMFSKNKNLELGEKILITDLSGNTVEYKIYDKFVTDPNDVSILETKDKTKRELTLITCKNGRSNRLIIKAKDFI